jgi:ABC-type uncharacterized transport system substrate-binding protein
MMLFRRHLQAAMLLMLSWPGAPCAVTNGIVTLASESGGAYAEVISTMRAELKGGNVEMTELSDADAVIDAQPMLAVAVGAQACQTLVENSQRPPLLCTLLPRAAFERIAAADRVPSVPISAQLLDQPVQRQMALIRLALPRKKRVGVLLGAESATFENGLAGAAKQHGLTLTVARISTAADLSEGLLRLLADSDLLLAVPDSQVFNSGTIQNILRATIARGIPSVGFSPAYVRAGTAIGIYATPAMIGTQTGQLVRRILLSGNWPAPQPPSDFEIGVNRAVARSLSIDVGDPATLKRRLEAAGATP